jgi:cytidyltransferase-like protein
MGKKIAITSVYANPLHPGHIECFELSRALADELIVIVNNDIQAKLKRGVESFQDEQYRMKVVASLKPVSKVVLSIDTDPPVSNTLTKVIEEVRAEHGNDCEIIFTKGGDRFANEIPERVVCDAFGVRIVDGLGAKTHNSSSYVARVANKADSEKLSAELASIPTEYKEKEYIEVGYRPWGVYYVLEDQPNLKIKKLIVSPKKRLSLQSHEKRSEHWVVVNGTATVQIREKDHPDHIGHRIVRTNESCHVPRGHIHRLGNEGDDHLVVIEVQSGEYTGEDDITRYEDDFNRHIT